MAEHKADHPHKFRYLLPPGNNFAFVAKFRIWLIISVLLMAASIGALFLNKARHGEYMNWTIDFKGGSEIIVSFRDKAGAPLKEDTAKVREAFAKAHEEGIELSDISYTESTPKGDVTVNGLLIRSPRSSALTDPQRKKATDDFMAKFADHQIGKATWSGDRLFVRTKKLVTQEEATPVFAADGLDLVPWNDKDANQYSHADEGTGEYTEVFTMHGVDKQYEKLLETAFPGVDVHVDQAYTVGAKAGDKLRDDAAKSIVFAIFLIMLYLAFRFDIRYAPGAAFATIHDAVMVIGVFAITWTEVSLTSVAGLLTVMGYSVNDTVIVFDRIRENQAKLKDKKIERIIDISINEMLVRTILTSSTVFATTLIMNIFGTGLVKNFAFAMNIGVIVGTYSSIFLAAPIFMYISRRWYSGPPKKRRIPVAAQPQPSAPAASSPDEE
ncbi:MAG: protein translocase subunit SecF [Deltaproteobacteria bacterium]|nr:protein translocase subunit SecF [Deltaproteobacteria bacterium]